MPSQSPGLEHPDRFGIWLGISLAALLIAGGLFMALSAPGLRLFSANGPGSGFLPLIIGLALAVVAGIYLIQRLAELRGHSSAAVADAAHAAVAAVGGTVENEAATPPPEAGLKRAGLIVGSLILLASALEYLGFQLSMFAFLLFHLRVLGKRSWISTLIVAVLGSFAVYFLFSNVLRVTLPRSDIPFLAGLGM